MSFIEAAYASVSCFPNRFIRQNIVNAADKMTQRMAAKCIKAEADDICRQHQRANTDAEMLLAVRTGEPHRLPGVVCEKEDKNNC